MLLPDEALERYKDGELTSLEYAELCRDWLCFRIRHSPALQEALRDGRPIFEAHIRHQQTYYRGEWQKLVVEGPPQMIMAVMEFLETWSDEMLTQTETVNVREALVLLDEYFKSWDTFKVVPPQAKPTWLKAPSTPISSWQREARQGTITAYVFQFNEPIAPSHGRRLIGFVLAHNTITVPMQWYEGEEVKDVVERATHAAVSFWDTDGVLSRNDRTTETRRRG